MTDEEIIQLYWERQEHAITETERKYGRQCLLLANRILHQMEDAEECVNDTWLNTWNTIPPKKPAFFQAFILKITRNLSLDRYRKNHTHRRGEGQMLVVLDELSECVADSSMPEELIVARDLENAVVKFLQKLSSKERNIFLHRYFLLENAAEIGEFYHVKPEMVRVSLLRTRKKLSAHLRKEGYL